MKDIDPMEKPNILTIGPVGSGKSSFIDSIVSIGKGRKYGMALTGNTGNTSCTYEFNPLCPISDESNHYRPNPTLADQCHCVIFVVSALAMDAGIQPALKKKIKCIQEQVRREHIPQILLITKVDEVYEETAKDITKVFSSIKIRDAVNTSSEEFGIEKSCIHPVKNYATDIDIETNTNIPLLIALKQAMEYAADSVEYI